MTTHTYTLWSWEFLEWCYGDTMLRQACGTVSDATLSAGRGDVDWASPSTFERVVPSHISDQNRQPRTPTMPWAIYTLDTLNVLANFAKSHESIESLSATTSGPRDALDSTTESSDYIKSPGREHREPLDTFSKIYFKKIQIGLALFLFFSLRFALFEYSKGWCSTTAISWSRLKGVW